MKNKQAKTTAESLKVSPEFDFFVHHPLTKYEGMYVAIIVFAKNRKTIFRQ